MKRHQIKFQQIKPQYWLIIGFLTALALFSVFTVNIRSVAADEFSMYWASEQMPSDIVKLYFSPKENNPPGMALLQHFWGQVFGFGDASLRVLSLALTLAALVVLWRIVAFFAHGIKTDETAQWRVFAIAASTPLVWMSANIARYQSLALLLGLGAFFAYVLWVHGKARKHLIIYALCTGAMFYVHYLSAAVFALCAGIHYLVTLLQKFRKKSPLSRTEVIVWAASQVAILLVILPIIFTIANAYANINLGVSTPAIAQSGKFKAAIMFFAATIIGIMNGFAVAPYTFWLVVPMAFMMLVLAFIAVQRTDLLNNSIGWMFVVMPLVVMSAVVVRMYPPLTIYLIPSVQRVPFLAPVTWIFLGFALVRLSNVRLQTALFLVILCCNVGAIVTWNLNTVATQHTPPLTELRDFTRAHTRFGSDISSDIGSDIGSEPNRKIVIAHTVAYRYGMEGVNSTSATSKNAVERYLPEITSLYWAETDIAKEVTLDSCKNLIRTMNAKHWVLFQRNRYPVNALHLAEALRQEGYTQTSEVPAQAQSGFDVWMKTKMAKLPVAGVKDDAAPQPYLYTFRHFERQKNKQ